MPGRLSATPTRRRWKNINLQTSARSRALWELDFTANLILVVVLILVIAFLRAGFEDERAPVF
jgi:hypothetical protein